MIWVMDQLDRVITREDAKKITGPNWANFDKYTYNDRNGNYVFCWDLTRYVNHSFEPNSILTSLNFEIAIRDIKEGEEITNDYGTFNCPEPFTCAKGPHKGRTFVNPDDLLTFHQEWDKLIAQAMKSYFQVEQPLQGYLSPAQNSTLDKIQRGEINFPSIKENHFYRKDD